jgi:ribonuclease PH
METRKSIHKQKITGAMSIPSVSAAVMMKEKEFDSLLTLADKGIKELIQVQKEVLKRKSMLFMAYNS